MKYKVILLLPLFAMLWTGCSKDSTESMEEPGEETANGDRVIFRFQISDGDTPPEDETRTAYGPVSNGYYPIYWRSGDRVEIMSPSTTPQQATVEVNVTGPTQGEVNLDDAGMKWGNTETCNFYAFYPSTAVKAASSSVISTAIPSVQTNNNGECNMNYAYMAACTEGAKRGEEVKFRFRPIMTTVTVSVKFSEAVQLQKLVLSSANGPVSGAFTYDVADHRCTVDPEKSSNVLALHMTTGAAPYLALTAGARVLITAFMLPKDIKGLTLSAVTAAGKIYSYTTDATLKAGHRYSFTISDMQKQAQQTFTDNSDWMKFLPDNVYLSQVSMPGSHDACTMFGSHYEYKSGMPDERYHYKFLQDVVFGFMNTTKIIKAQELSIEEQLAAGVRMFDLRPSSPGSSVSDLAIHHGVAQLGDPSLGGYTPGGTDRQPFQPFRLSHMLNRFVDFLEKHPGETVLVHMKYENTSTSLNKTGWDKSIVSYIKQCCNGRIATFSPKMTLADARGKILFVIREDYKSSNGGEYLGAYLNWTSDKVVFDTTLSGNNVGQAPIRVNDLYNIKNGASDGKTKYQAIEECIDYTYNTTDVTRWCMNYVSCYDTSQCSVSGISVFGAVGDYDYCANKYNKYTADRINATDFRGNVGIVLMDFAGAANATMTFSQTYSNMAVYGDDLVKAVVCNNNKWALRCSE
ncbi:fimbrillin family protein [uncultured Alistipes sp.]|jgi:hypothetical protein|uniref:fimbrillin family protein n=1 Tax=uncultured Alistipes sp. TaxID=538949 RepID=UPI0025E4B746|nr:fimbrillin family protein [uncultured Alistipes sp.]